MRPLPPSHAHPRNAPGKVCLRGGKRKPDTQREVATVGPRRRAPGPAPTVPRASSSLWCDPGWWWWWDSGPWDLCKEGVTIPSRGALPGFARARRVDRSEGLREGPRDEPRGGERRDGQGRWGGAVGSPRDRLGCAGDPRPCVSARGGGRGPGLWVPGLGRRGGGNPRRDIGGPGAGGGAPAGRASDTIISFSFKLACCRRRRSSRRAPRAEDWTGAEPPGPQWRLRPPTPHPEPPLYTSTPRMP